MANERLRSCITGARLTISDVAAQVGVDPKTVERWIVPGRLPHRSHRWATASLLGTDEAYLWPELADDRRTQVASAAELVTTGHVRVNSVRVVAPSHPVKVGDVLTIALDRRIRVWNVADFSERRGDATAARKLYVELQE